MLRVTRDRDGVVAVEMRRVVAGRALLPAYAYWVDGLLIDAGFRWVEGDLVAWARRQGVDRIVLTHHHEDHAGAAGALTEVLGCQVLAPPGSLEDLARPRPIELYRRVVWGRPRPVRAAPLGDTFRHGPFEFRVLPAPGHTADHVVFLETGRGWLFSGDVWLGRRVRYMNSKEEGQALLESLTRLAGLPVTTLYSGHRGPVGDGRQALADLASFLGDLRHKARQLAEQGVAVPVIARRLLGPEDAMAWITRGAISKANLIRGLLG